MASVGFLLHHFQGFYSLGRFYTGCMNVGLMQVFRACLQAFLKHFEEILMAEVFLTQGGNSP